MLSACGLDAVGALAAEELPATPAEGPEPAPALDGERDAAVPDVPALCSDPALAFDGVDDQVTVPHDEALDLRDDFTVEAWVRPGPGAAMGAEMVIASHHDKDASRGWVLRFKGGRVELIVLGNEALIDSDYVAGDHGPAYVVANQWAHVAGTRKGDELRVYYGGVLRDTQALGFFFSRDHYSGPLRIGRGAAKATDYFQGEIDELRLSRIVRYTGETAPRPAGPFAVDEATVSLFRFDEAQGTTAALDETGAHPGELGAGAEAPARVPVDCIPGR